MSVQHPLKDGLNPMITSSPQEVEATLTGKENWGMGSMGGHPMMNNGGEQEEPVTVSPFSHIPSYLLPPLYEISSLSNFSEERPAVEMRREFKSEAILTLVLLVHAAIFLAGVSGNILLCLVILRKRLF